MNESALNQLYLQETPFNKLMQRRIFNVLLIASRYDAFMLEEDGRVEEQLYFEYVGQNLSSPPRVTRVSNFDEAMERLKNNLFDLVIAMPNADIGETIEGSELVKSQYPDIPFVILTPFSKEVSKRFAKEPMPHVDYVFSWLGNMDLLLAIIKLLEDQLNAEDITEVGVEMILLVEDSVRFYSTVLPTVYKFLFRQSQEFATEALNEHEKMLRMRARPKVMLARDYEEAEALFKKYEDNILGVISDISFMRNGEKDRAAGLKLAEWIKSIDPSMPVILESSEVENRAKAEEIGVRFLDKNSKKFPVDLGEAISEDFGFGDFIVRDPKTGKEIMRISNLKQMQRKVFDIPAESLMYHASHSDFSRWFYSRALFPIAKVLKKHRFENLDEAPAVRRLYFDLIVKYRRMKNRGVIAEFQRDRFDNYSNFARIGQGSLGGKGRGLAFIDSIIKKNPICDNFYGMTISIPRTVVLCTDIFDEFMEMNNLYPVALSDASDEEILEAFIAAELPQRINEDFLALFDVVDKPLAIRSSSLLEDSHYQPFAGVYSTYMVPCAENYSERLKMLTDAVKSVYASVYYSSGKRYMSATSNIIEQEKMAVIIQEVVGQEYNGYYFPIFSGVGKSLNFYPLGNEKVEDGVAEVAVGLGKYIVDGGKSLRFSPLYPQKALQTSTLEMALRDTQTNMFVLPLKDRTLKFTSDDGFNIERHPVQEFAGTGALRLTSSTYRPESGILTEGDSGPGRRVITFANILRDRALPLAPAIDFMLKQGQTAMQRPVEIEFAGELSDDYSSPIKGNIYWLQIRPITDRKDTVSDSVLEIPESELLLKSESALGNGKIEGLRTVVYIREANFDSSRSQSMAMRLSEINTRMMAQNREYILLGPGRWGSSDPALGIPVKWSDISNARLIAEVSYKNFRVEPSQGTHFFHNLTSFGVGYVTVNPLLGRDILDTDYLDSQIAEYEDTDIRVVEFDKDLGVALNGHRGFCIVTKAGFINEINDCVNK